MTRAPNPNTAAKAPSATTFFPSEWLVLVLDEPGTKLVLVTVTEPVTKVVLGCTDFDTAEELIAAEVLGD